MKPIRWSALIAACVMGAAGAEEPAAKTSDDAVRMDPMNIEGKPWLFNRKTRYSHLLPEVDGTAITVTKKNTVTKLDEQPTIIDNNQREVFARLPGLVIAEQQNPGQLNVNYRGIGGNGALGTQESELLLSLQDGLPIASDWIGFPTTYYLPVPQSIGEIQFIRGSSGLLYGPEPAALNYVSRKPVADRAFAGYSEHVFGSNSLYSTFNTASGTSGAFNYLANAHHREADGERANGRYKVNDGDLHFGVKLAEGQTLSIDGHAYAEDSGEAGRMSYDQFQADPTVTTTPFDHNWVERYTGVLTYSFARGEGFLWETKAWSGYSRITERNQNGPGNAANFADQRFHYAGLDSRARLRWARANALTAGFVLYRSSSPNIRSTSPDLAADRDAEANSVTLNQQRTAKYGAVFAENVFRFGRFHVVPSVRFEREILGIEEPVPPAPQYAVNQSYNRNTPLFGLGFGNDFGRGNETYVSVAQGYRPLRWLDVAPTRPGVPPATNNPDTTDSLTYEAGVHGWPIEGLYYDVSIYQADYKNRIESIPVGTNETMNVNTGDTRHRGAEGMIDYDFLRLTDAPADAHLEGYANLAYLDAEFTAAHGGGVSDGNTPGYAPHLVAREGVIWRKDHGYKLSLSAVTVTNQFTQDNNQPLAPGPQKIPSHTVVDFAADYYVLPSVRVLGGVSNLTDREYFSRALFGGVEPAPGRTFYVGVSAEL